MFEDLAIDGAEEELRKGVLHGVVVDVGAVNEFYGLGGIGEGLVVARDNLGDGDFVTAFEESLGDAVDVDFGVAGADEEKTDEESSSLCLANELQFFVAGEDRLEDKILLLLQAFVAYFGSTLCCLHHSFGGVPIAKFLLGNVVGIDVEDVCRPFAFEELNGRGCLARPIRSGYDAEGWTAFGAHSATARFCLMRRAVSASIRRLASSARAVDLRAATATFSMMA